MTNLDKVLIQLFWNASEGGNYFAIYRLSKFIDMSSIALGMLLFPTISALFAKNNIQNIKSLSIRSERYLSMAVFPIVFFMVFNAQAIIHILLSNRFYSAIPILQILPFFALFDALGRPYEMKLLGMNMPHFSRNRIVIMVIANLILNIILIPRDIQSLGITLVGYGAIGAAIATVIAYFIGLVYTRLMVWKISRIKINYRIFLHLFAAVSMGLILQYINNTIYSISRWYDLLLFGFLGLIIYFGILYIFKEFSKKDFLFFIDILNIKKMLRYIRDELKEK